MGQVQSQQVEEKEKETPPTDKDSPSLDSLIEEAAAFGEEDDNLSMEEKAKRALECPCIAHLRSGPCGSQFSDAFLCFLKSTAPEKGSDCVNPFVALQSCIKVNPDAFSKDILGGDDEHSTTKDDVGITGVDKPSQEKKIRPPLWSVESKTKQKQKS